MQTEQMRAALPEEKKAGFEKEEIKRMEEGQPGLFGPYGIAAVYNKKLANFKDKVFYAIAGKDLVGDILTRIAVGFITGVPVARTNERGEITEILGFVDILDILACLLKTCGVKISEKGEATAISEEALENIGKLSREFRGTPIENILGWSGRNTFATVDENLTLADGIQYLKEYHRLAIKDSTGRITGIVSQSLVANYLAKNLHRIKLDPRLNKKLDSFPFKTEKVKVVNRDTRVLDAFVQMHAMKVYAVGVVDNDGKLCGNLSASDLKGWHVFERRFRLLLRPVWRFLNHARKVQFRSGDFVAALNNQNTWWDLLHTFEKYRVHRVYLVDDNNKPAGVITLTDFMKALAPTEATGARKETKEGLSSE